MKVHKVGQRKPNKLIRWARNDVEEKSKPMIHIYLGAYTDTHIHTYKALKLVAFEK